MSGLGRALRASLLAAGVSTLLATAWAQDGRTQIRIAYGTGLSAGDSTVAWTRPVYQEEASYAVDYRIGKGRSFYAGVGYLITDVLGIGFGCDRTSSDLSAECEIRVPHPLYFDSSREALGAAAGGLTETVLSLDLLVRSAGDRVSVGGWAGPSVFLAGADVVGAMPFTESEYPYESVSVDSETERLRKTVVGLSTGASVDIRLSRGLALSVIARYLTARAAFQPSGDAPPHKLTLGGFKLGGGLRLTL